MLEEDEFAPWPQDSSHASKGLYDAVNCAQREGADDRIDRAILQGDALARQV